MLGQHTTINIIMNNYVCDNIIKIIFKSTVNRNINMQISYERLFVRKKIIAGITYPSMRLRLLQWLTTRLRSILEC